MGPQMVKAISKWLHYGAMPHLTSKENDYGISIDLVYDTYQKDWSKAYQLAFHGFFTHIDYLSNYNDGEFFSYIRHSYVFRFAKPDGTLLPVPADDKMHQFSKIITEDVKALDSARLGEIHGLPKHSKAPLYDIMGGVLFQGKYPRSGSEQFGHGSDYWLGEGGDDYGGFSKRLSVEAFAHMASSAVVNQPAFKAFKDYLPNAYKMFLDILGIEVLCLEKREVGRHERRKRKKAELFEVEKVEVKPEASLGEMVEYKVTRYRIGENFFSTNSLIKDYKYKSLSAEEEMRIIWAEKIGDGKITNIVGENNKRLTGAEIQKRMDSRLVGKTILVMACVEGFNEEAGQKTAVRDITQSDLLKAGLEPRAYNSLDEAGVDAVRSINPSSIHEDAEYSGSIHMIGDKFYNTYPKRGFVDKTWAAPVNSIGKLVGWFHTHGRENPNYDSEAFSDEDMHTSYVYQIPGFLGTPLSSDVQVYEPPSPSSSHYYNDSSDNYDYYIFLNMKGNTRFLS